MGISAHTIDARARARAGIRLGPDGRALPPLLDPVAGHALIELAIDPPTVTHHDKRIERRGRRLTLVDSPALRAARAAYEAAIPPRPGPAVVPLARPVLLKATFTFRRPAGVPPGPGCGPADDWHCDAPDADNSAKLLADVLAGRGYVAVDAHVALLVVAKRWGVVPGVRVYLRTLLSPDPALDPGLELPVPRAHPGWVYPIDYPTLLAARGEWEAVLDEWPYGSHRRAARGPAASGQRPAASGQRPGAGGERRT